MKRFNLIRLTITTVCTALLAAGTAAAHSNHDHSHLPVGWTFDRAVQNKIEKTLANEMNAVGLSSFEQNTLSKYDIGVGNSFTTRVGDTMMKITRTSGGIRIAGPVSSTDNLFSLPIVQSEEPVRRVSTMRHPGHDHRHLALAWVFDDAIKNKIHNNVFFGDASGAVGLAKREQKLLARYGIRVGNSFRAHVDGMTFTMQRTSLGLRILAHEIGLPMAEVPTARNAY